MAGTGGSGRIPPGVGAEIAFSGVLPGLGLVVALLLAILHFARSEFGPALAVLLSGWLGTVVWAAVVAAVLLARHGG